MFCPLRMVLELCAEGDLLDALGKNKITSRELKLRIAIDVANGMNFLHRLIPPLAHRDLRSPNVLLKTLDYATDEVVAKIGDFGLTCNFFFARFLFFFLIIVY
jgi:serine/threonine protein kinase